MMSCLLQKKKLPRMCEFIKNRLYFITLHYKPIPKSRGCFYFFSIDNELVYTNFYSDFGPLNLASLYKYCTKLNTKLSNPSLSSKVIVHCTSRNPKKRANAAFLIASYAILYLNMTPKQALDTLLSEGTPFLSFQDACIGTSYYVITLLDCLNGLYRASKLGFFRFDDFEVEEYERYSKYHNGDLNWIVPQKFLAFSGPLDSIPFKRPETYINYFHFYNVTTVIRLNTRKYDSCRFVRAGFKHYDMFFYDGAAPPEPVITQFLCVSEQTSGAIAVHCKAGLGRTGSLIGAYLVKHYQMTAKEAIAWLRICRPGSVVGYQQAWLESMQPQLWKAGERFRVVRYQDKKRFPIHPYGVYSIIEKYRRIKQYNIAMDWPHTYLGMSSRASGDSSCHVFQSLPTLLKPEYRYATDSWPVISETELSSQDIEWEMAESSCDENCCLIR